MIPIRSLQGYQERAERFQFKVRVMNVLKHSFTSMICEHSGYGKTSFCVRLIVDLDKLCTVSGFRDIVGVLVKTAIPREHSTGSARRITYHTGIRDFEKASNGTRPVVLDDLLNEGRV
jgi:hypothetical protein